MDRQRRDENRKIEERSKRHLQGFPDVPGEQARGLLSRQAKPMASQKSQASKPAQPRLDAVGHKISGLLAFAWVTLFGISTWLIIWLLADNHFRFSQDIWIDAALLAALNILFWVGTYRHRSILVVYYLAVAAGAVTLIIRTLHRS